MIATLVLFPTDGSIDLDDATQRFNGTAPSYRGLAGLRTKAYLFAEDASDLGGFYVWESRAAAEAIGWAGHLFGQRRIGPLHLDEWS